MTARRVALLTLAGAGGVVLAIAACSSFEESTPPFCKSVTADAFCVDFEPPDASIAPAPFTLDHEGALPAVLVDDPRPGSTKALSAPIDGLTDAGAGAVLLATRRGSFLRCAFAVQRRGGPGQDQLVAVAALTAFGEGDTRATAVAYASNDSVIAVFDRPSPDGGGATVRGLLPFALAEGAWRRFVVQADLRSSPAVLELFPEDDPSQTERLTTSLPSPAVFQFRLGILGTSTAATGTNLFDDVVCTSE